MPCSPFVKKGCSYTLENDKVYLRGPEKNVILEGHDVGGLYYYHSRTVRVADSETTPKSGAPALGVPLNHGVYFGLPSTGTVSAGATDLARRLLETHWAFGHLHFDKLRKMLGLKKGDNPDCPACTIAKSRMERLKHTCNSARRAPITDCMWTWVSQKTRITAFSCTWTTTPGKATLIFWK